MKSFLEFVEEKQGTNPESNGDKEKGIASRTSLGDGNDFKPFVVSDDPNSEFYGSNSALAPVIRAFKKGANWGWSTDSKTGEDKPVKIGSKKLYLIGGAVRDHLAGKKPRNVELATPSSPDEIFQILKQNGFEFGGKEDNKAPQSFWVLEKDTRNRPFKFGVRVKNDQYELSVFGSNVEGEFKSASHEEDSKNRDFTINALSLLLTNDNGPNKEVNDFYGGLHHLKAGQIVPIGDLSSKLEEDPLRIPRFARMLSKYGKPETLGAKEREIISSKAPLLAKVDRSKLADEFMRIFDSGDPRGHLQVYSDLGLLQNIFPLDLDTDMPKELSEIGDKHMPLAWMMRKAMPQEIENGMDGFDPELKKKILFLIKTMGLNQQMMPEHLYELKNEFYTSGVSSRSLKAWATKLIKKDEKLVDAFIEHVKSPRINFYVSENSEQIAPEFSDFYNPINGYFDQTQAEFRRQVLELANFKKLLSR